MSCFSSIFNTLTGMVKSIVNALIDGIKSLINAITELVEDLLANFLLYFSNTMVAGTLLYMKASAGKFGWYGRAIVGIINAHIPGVANLGGFIGALEGRIINITSLIHLNTIEKVKNISYFVSSAWTAFNHNLIVKIANLSEKLEIGRNYMNNILYIAKFVYFDAGSALGRSHDVNMIGWLQTLQDFFQSFRYSITRWRKNSEAFLRDVETHIIKPAIDAKAAAMAAIWDQLEKLTQGLHTFLNTFYIRAEHVNDAFVNVWEVMNKIKIDPQALLRKAKEDCAQNLSTWVKNHFDSYVSTVDAEFDGIDTKLDIHGKSIASLQYFVDHPGSLLRRVDRLSDNVKNYQEGLIEEVTGRRFASDTNNLDDEAKPLLGNFYGTPKDFDDLYHKKTFAMKDIPTPEEPEKLETKPRIGWFCGDY